MFMLVSLNFFQILFPSVFHLFFKVFSPTKIVLLHYDIFPVIFLKIAFWKFWFEVLKSNQPTLLTISGVYNGHFYEILVCLDMLVC